MLRIGFENSRIAYLYARLVGFRLEIVLLGASIALARRRGHSIATIWADQLAGVAAADVGDGSIARRGAIALQRFILHGLMD